MNAKEKRYVRKLEIKIEELEAMNRRHMDIYRENITEIIELRSRIIYIEEVAREMVAVIEGAGA